MDGDSGPGRELVYLRTADHDYDLATVACARAHNAALESNRQHGIPSPEASSSSSSSRVTAGLESSADTYIALSPCTPGSQLLLVMVAGDLGFSSYIPWRFLFRARERSVSGTVLCIQTAQGDPGVTEEDERSSQPAHGKCHWVEEEDSGMVSSNDLGPMISDASKFKTLSLNDSPPALDSTDRAVVHAGDVGTGLPDSTIMAQPAAEEALSRRSERSTADLLLDQPTFDSVEDAMDYFCNSLRVARAARYKALPLSSQSSPEKIEAQRVLAPPHQAQRVPAQEQASAVATQGRYEGSKEKTAENGNKWMCEEVWMAFQNYLKKQDLMEFDYEFEELICQCFHVESDCKIFDHFNFTVKMKEPGSSEWISTRYFAEVKEILRRTIYFCCPLEPDEYGIIAMHARTNGWIICSIL